MDRYVSLRGQWEKRSVQISAIIEAVLSGLENRPPENLPILRVGDVLTGKILRLESDGRLLIDLGAFRVLAHSDVVLQPGQVLRLQVDRAGIPLILKPEGETALAAANPPPRLDFGKILGLSDQQRLGAIIDRLADWTGGRISGDTAVREFRQDLLSLKSICDPLPLNRPAEQIVQQLKTVFENGGMFLEKKVADKIIAVAHQHDVPLVADPNLSCMLEALDVDMEIPAEMYRAVAEVLVFVYRLNRGHR